VACRTAETLEASAVLCLSFPLHPPGRPGQSRADELRRPVEAGIPLHVIQGQRDPFGTPQEVRAELPDPAFVTAAKGTHSFGRSPADVIAAARAFLTEVVS
jgi:predicted alpha/beta-hydrolase family hydrolase